MAFPTKTRQQLRKAVARELRMPFFRYYNGLSTATSGSTAAKLVDTKLTQKDGFWTSAFAFMRTGAALGDVREVSEFQSKDDTIMPDRDFSAAVVAGDEYELHTIWNAFELHDAINRAISEGFSAFFDVAMDESLVVQADTLEYTLPTLANKIWRVVKVFVERPTTAIMGTATAGGASTISDAARNFVTDGVVAGWRVSIYDKTGKGQLATIASASGSQITVTAPWTTQPDATSRYKVWDPSAQRLTWERMRGVRFDSKEFPAKMYLSGSLTAYYGSRVRLQVLCKPAELTEEASTTVVPEEYIVLKAVSILWDQRKSDNRFDRQQAGQNSADYQQKADTYKAMKAWDAPDGTMWLDEDEAGVTVSDPLGNPMGW